MSATHIVDEFSKGILKGKLDQRAGLLRVQGAIGRDVKPDETQGMTQKLLRWFV